MLRIRKSQDRGYADHGWLKTYHTFSFAGYDNPNHRGFRSLRVINEDCVEPGQGFGSHPHHDMEILSYVLSGALEHKDSLGHGSVLRAGQFQRMTAGTGVVHSEFNPSATESVHFYQIWLRPERSGLKPSYEDRGFHDEQTRNRLCVVASPDGRDESMVIHQDAVVYLAQLDTDRVVLHTIGPNRHAWLQVLEGAVTVNGVALEAGDGLAVSDETNLEIQASQQSQVMLFDLA